LNLQDLGWDDGFAAALQPHDNCIAGRVSAQHRGEYDVLTEAGELRAHVAGRLRHEATSGADLPAVGDWVAHRDAVIHAVLPRRTAFARKVNQGNTEAQVLAANVDTVFVVTGLDDDFSPHRIERYLTLAWESGATPALVLTKADLCDDPLALLLQAEQVALGASTHVVSNVTGEGLDELAPYLEPAKTVALLGSSGVGKSSLANRLLGHEAQATKELAEDGTGRHTTVARQLIRLPGGALLVDTPGLREVQLWDAEEGIDHAFSDVDDLAAGCRFNDCAHKQEPGCAVQEAIDEGRLPRERLQSYRALQRELRRLAMKQDARLRSEEKKKRVAFARSRRKSAW
jgi:ribosome biogenesis GTPase / thiamine phosphate phosphatase